MMGLIAVDFEDAYRKAKQIAQDGEKIIGHADKIKGMEASISSAWSGDSASLFLKRYEKHAMNLRQNAVNLKKNAEALKRSTDKLKEAEMFGKHIFS